MPNYCDCDLLVRGNPEDVAAFLKKAESPKPDGEGKLVPLDFNSFVPMPKELNLPAGGPELGYEAKYGTEMELRSIFYHPWAKDLGRTREALLEHLAKTNPEALALAEKYKENIEKHGHRHWYSWCTAHWGTKWGANDPELIEKGERRARLCFTTAWSPPKPVVEAMAEQFPSLRITLKYYEGGAGFAGTLEYKGGEVVKDDEREYRGRRGG